MFHIATDTSANLPWSFIEENRLTVIPLCYLIDGVEHTEPEGGAFDGPAYYSLQRQGIRISTSQVTPQRYIDCFRPLLEEGQDILFVGMSSGISGSYHSAEIAAQELRAEFPERRLRLVDTLGASLGEGLLVMMAVDCLQKGMSLDDTAVALLAKRPYVCQFLMVDDLFYLKRTGRVSGATALVGSLLGIKPVLRGSPQGQLVVYMKVRGRKQAIRAMAEKYRQFVRNAQEQTVCIAHADCPQDAAFLADLLREAAMPKEILTVCYEPVTGAHTGPDALALFFLGDSDVRTK